MAHSSTKARAATLRFGLAAGVLAFAAACATTGDGTADPAQAHPRLWPVAESPVGRDPAIEAEITRLMADMTLEEKVGQIIQGDIGSITPEDVAQYHLGSVLNGGNSAPGNDLHAPAEDWLALADAFWDASRGPDGTGIPVIWGSDAVHGHANVVGATVFPQNIGLGATNDPELLRRIGAVTAVEMAVTGLDWTFAPTIATPRNDRWGRTYEGYSEDPRIVAAYAREMVLGLQGEPGTDEFLGDDKIIATVKHFLGDGGTRDGIDQGETIATERELARIHGAGYPPAIDAGVQVVMASYSSWNGVKMHGNKSLLTDVLVGRMGFDGFVVGDWNGHGQVDGCTPTDCAASFNAGLDMFMAPDSWRGLYENTLAEVRSGEITMERLDEAVARVLRVKLRADVMNAERPSARPLGGRFELLGSPEHRAVAREAVRKSMVLLKNDGVLPLAPSANVLVAGASANDFGMQTGGWTISWQGDGNTAADFPGGTTIFDGIAETVAADGGSASLSVDGSYEEKPDVAIVVFGEPPYAEFRGDRPNVDYADDAALETLQALQAAGIPTVSVFLSGRPLWVNPELNASDAFVAAWLPGTEGDGIAEVLFADASGAPRYDFTGRLSFSWPKRPTDAVLNVGQRGYDPLFAYGYGLSYGDDGALAELPTDYEITSVGGDDVFTDGDAQEPWSLALVPDDGPTIPVSAPTAATNDGSLRLSRVDRDAQEDALVLSWSGGQEASLIATGGPIDWTRQSNGDLAIRVDYRVDAAAAGPVTLGLDCGADCGATYPLVAAGTAPGDWSSTVIRLRCFATKGADMSAVERPLILSSATANRISVSYVGLAPTPGGATCPE